MGPRTGAPRALAFLSMLLSMHVLASPAAGAAPPEEDASTEALKEMSLEQLLNVEVTSVSKSAEPLSDAAAAIYVISRDDILRSGARTVPDMLRLAPSLQVAQITASTFAITARGFNGPAASKLLVLIDGRSVYTPYHSGVSWDVQNVLPEDVERIEVIRGPGATLWGANAVNGVINIITRNAADTQGGSLALGGGNLEQNASVQYGGKLRDDLSYRAYVNSYHHSDDVKATGADAMDNWHRTDGGFRLDWTPSADLVTLQGDLYQGSENRSTPPAQAISGANLLARWNHEMSNGSGLQIQTYYDYVAFSLPGTASDYLNTVDLQIQHSFSWGASQRIVWGGGVRRENDNFPSVLSSAQPLAFIPQTRTLYVSDAFIQDSLSLSDSLKLILGAKLEDEPYTGLEPLPSARLSWKVTDSNLLWMAVSRAVRAPSRIDRDLFEEIGPVVYIKGADFQPEKLLAYELGYRAQPSQSTSVSVSTFYNVYDDLRSVELSPGGQLPAMFSNGMEGNTYGVEAWVRFRASARWQLTAGGSWLHENLHFKPGSNQLGGVALAGNDPSYQLSIGSVIQLAPAWVLNIDLRRVAALTYPVSPAYTEAGARLGWNVSRRLEISLSGANLLHAHHLEFGTTPAVIQLGPTGVETGRSVYLETRLRF